MLVSVLLAPLLWQAPSSSGRALYRGEQSVTARLANSDDPLPASATACQNCHGESAEGGREAGVEVAPITWRALTRGPQPRYDEHSFCRAVREGIGANGNELSVAMPRYALTPTHCQAIWHYLRTLDEAPLHGLSPDRVGVAVLAGASTGPASTVAGRLASAFAAVNARGGLWGRRLELVSPADAGILIVLEGRAPATTSSQTLVLHWQADPPDSSSFVVSASPEAQARAALRALAAHPILLTPAGSSMARWTASWRDAASELGWRVADYGDIGVCRQSPVVVLAQRVAFIPPTTLSECAGGTVLFHAGPFPSRTSERWRFLRLLPQAPFDEPTALTALADSLREALEASGRKALLKNVRRSLAAAFRARSGEPSRLMWEVHAVDRDGTLVRWR